MSPTRIEWTDETWNPVTGCTPVSPGCDHCYARRMATTRLRGRRGYPADDPFRVALHPDRLAQPLRWRKPRRVFTCSMGDLFHEAVPDSTIDRVFAVMALAPQHQFQVLTKRATRARDVLSAVQKRKEGMADAWIEHVGPYMGPTKDDVEAWCRTHGVSVPERARRVHIINRWLHADYAERTVHAERGGWTGWPLPNVLLGVTAEDQPRADERIPLLLDCPAAVRFVSIEPMLGAVDLTWLPSGQPFELPQGDRCQAMQNALRRPREHAPGETVLVPAKPGLDWVIVGGETGPGARPMHPQWVRDIRDHCVANGVPFFFKQWGEWAGKTFEDIVGPHDNLLDGRTWQQFPD